MTQIDIAPIHFGIITVFNFPVGLMTPPVSSVLFVGTSVAKATLEEIVKAVLPFFAVLFIDLLIVTYIPRLSFYQNI